MMGVLLAAYGSIFGLITVGLAWRYEQRKKTLTNTLLPFILASLWLMLLVRGGYLILSPIFWLYTIPLVPLASALLMTIWEFGRITKPLMLNEQVREQEDWIRRQQNKRETRKIKCALHKGVPKQTNDKNWLTLGVRFHGDKLPTNFHLRAQAGWLQLDEQALDQHLFILGATGSGKSEMIKRLVQDILNNSDRNLYFIDGKGDDQLAKEIRTMAHKAGRGAAPIFKLGHDKHGALYDGFRGNANVIYNRLLAAIRIGESQGNALYHANRNRTVLGWAINAHNGTNPPRSFPELLQRLDERWLMAAYKDDALIQKRISKLADDKAIESLDYHLYPLYQQFHNLIHPAGFGLEDERCAIFSIRTQSVGDSAKQFLNFLLEDFKDFIGNRQTHPSVLIIDEFGQFDNDNIIALMTMARGANMAIILATQDLATLKDPKTTDIVLANSLTKIIMRTDRPEEMVNFAGTHYQAETSTHIVEGELGDEGSVRLQHAFKIPPNEVPKLRAGQAFVVSHRYVSKIYAPQVATSGADIADQEPEYPKVSAPKLPKKTQSTESFETGTAVF